MLVCVLVAGSTGRSSTSFRAGVGFAGQWLNRGRRAAFVILAMPAFALAWFIVRLPSLGDHAALWAHEDDRREAWWTRHTTC